MAGKGKPGDEEKERRLAEALRANLRRRKAQAKARVTPRDAGSGATVNRADDGDEPGEG